VVEVGGGRWWEGFVTRKQTFSGGKNRLAGKRDMVKEGVGGYGVYNGAGGGGGWCGVSFLLQREKIEVGIKKRN